MRGAAEAFQHADGDFPVHRIVLDQQDFRHERAAGGGWHRAYRGIFQQRVRRRSHGPGDAVQELRAAQGFGEDRGEQLHRAGVALVIVAHGEHDEAHGRETRIFTDVFRQRDAVHAGHLIVQQRKIEARALRGAQHRQRLGAGLGRYDLDSP